MATAQERLAQFYRSADYTRLQQEEEEEEEKGLLEGPRKLSEDYGAGEWLSTAARNIPYSVAERFREAGEVISDPGAAIKGIAGIAEGVWDVATGEDSEEARMARDVWKEIKAQTTDPRKIAEDPTAALANIASLVAPFAGGGAALAARVGAQGGRAANILSKVGRAADVVSDLPTAAALKAGGIARRGAARALGPTTRQVGSQVLGVTGGRGGVRTEAAYDIGKRGGKELERFQEGRKGLSEKDIGDPLYEELRRAEELAGEQAVSGYGGTEEELIKQRLTERMPDRPKPLPEMPEMPELETDVARKVRLEQEEAQRATRAQSELRRLGKADTPLYLQEDWRRKQLGLRMKSPERLPQDIEWTGPSVDDPRSYKPGQGMINDTLPGDTTWAPVQDPKTGKMGLEEAGSAGDAYTGVPRELAGRRAHIELPYTDNAPVGRAPISQAEWELPEVREAIEALPDLTDAQQEQFYKFYDDLLETAELDTPEGLRATGDLYEHGENFAITEDVPFSVHPAYEKGVLVFRDPQKSWGPLVGELLPIEEVGTGTRAPGAVPYEPPPKKITDLKQIAKQKSMRERLEAQHEKAAEATKRSHGKSLEIIAEAKAEFKQRINDVRKNARTEFRDNINSVANSLVGGRDLYKVDPLNLGKQLIKAFEPDAKDAQRAVKALDQQFANLNLEAGAVGVGMQQKAPTGLIGRSELSQLSIPITGAAAGGAYFLGGLTLALATLPVAAISFIPRLQAKALQRLGVTTAQINDFQRFGLKTRIALKAAGITYKRSMTLGEAMHRLGVIGDAAEVKDENVESFLSRMGKEKEGTEREDVESFLSRMRGN